MKIESLGAIAVALQDVNVRYLIVGGLAVAAHGYGRATFDVDIVIQLQPDNTRRAMTALGTLGYKPTVPVSAHEFADPLIRESWIRDKRMVVFQLHSELHRETRIDLFVAEPFDFDHEYDRALVGDLIPGMQLRFVGIEALIRMKEAAGREKDKEDVRQLKKMLGVQNDGR